MKARTSKAVGQDAHGSGFCNRVVRHGTGLRFAGESRDRVDEVVDSENETLSRTVAIPDILPAKGGVDLSGGAVQTAFPNPIRCTESVSLTSVNDYGVSIPRRTENEPDELLPAQERVSRRGSDPSWQHTPANQSGHGQPGQGGKTRRRTRRRGGTWQICRERRANGDGNQLRRLKRSSSFGFCLADG